MWALYLHSLVTHVAQVNHVICMYLLTYLWSALYNHSTVGAQLIKWCEIVVLSVVKFLNAYTSCSLCSTVLYQGYAFGPGSLSLSTLVFVWCPQLLQNQRYSSNMINHCQNPAHQAKALGTNISLERSCWSFNTVVIKKSSRSVFVLRSCYDWPC